nr:MAG TPA: putative terminase small subunit [Caudoviricetes sp.]
MKKEESKGKFLEALAAAAGIVLTACESVNVSRSTYYRWYKEDAAFAERVDEISEEQLDFVEGKLLKSIKDGDTTAIIFYLKTKGKKRGYSEKQPPKEETLQPQTAAAIVDEASTKKKLQRIKQRLRNKRNYITKLLKKQNKWMAEMTYQVEITAKILVRVELLEEEIFSAGYTAVNVEYSREGNARVSLNPQERLYLESLGKAQKALRALGMNTESKERKGENDGLGNFLKEFVED